MQTAYATSQNQGSTETLFMNFTNRFRSINDTQSNIIGQIEDKVHSILNRRVPTDTANKAQEKSINDAATEFESQFERLNHQATRLEILLKHLSEII